MYKEQNREHSWPGSLALLVFKRVFLVSGNPKSTSGLTYNRVGQRT